MSRQDRFKLMIQNQWLHTRSYSRKYMGWVIFTANFGNYGTKWSS